MNGIGKLLMVGLLAALAYLGFYVYGLVMGVFSPAQMIGFTIAAVAVVALFAAYSARIRHAVSSRSDPAHDEIVRGARHQRELRGF